MRVYPVAGGDVLGGASERHPKFTEQRSGSDRAQGDFMARWHRTGRLYSNLANADNRSRHQCGGEQSSNIVVGVNTQSTGFRGHRGFLFSGFRYFVLFN
jgi:hypothetical protein